MSGRGRILSLGALLAVLLAGLFASRASNTKSDGFAPLVRGGNARTILFFGLAESGQINAQLATTQALLEKYPDFKIHFVSFASMRDKVDRVSSFARSRNPSVQEIVFHELPGPDRMFAIMREMNCTGPLECLAHPPGARGASALAHQMELMLWSWTGEEHIAIYRESIDIIERVDPVVAVVDFAFRPPWDAILHLNRAHVVITPLALADLFAAVQPYASALWKYPTWGTGFSFPVPWHQIPENIYINLRILYNLYLHPHTGEAVKFLRQHGIADWALFTPRPDVPFITQTLPGASLPLEIVPDSVTCAGTILLDSAPAEKQDPELVEWVQKAPTVVINLGSLFKYTPERAVLMAKAVQAVLENTNSQVLWKMTGSTEFGDDFTAPLTEYLKQDRLRIANWLTIDTLSLLQIDSVIASIHHGGSSSFNEAVTAGVPQVVIPIWEDHYNFAQLTEDLGLGIYATRGTAPEWTVDGIAKPILRVLNDDEESMQRRSKANQIGRLARETPGRYIAADVIAKLVLSE